MSKVIAALILMAASTMTASANGLEDCDFNHEQGACSASITVDKDRNIYTVPSAGICRTVTVQIDGTRYPHKQYHGDIVESVMVLDKSKEYSVSVDGCTAHPTKEESVQRCEPPFNEARSQCAKRVQAQADICSATIISGVGARPECMAELSRVEIECYSNAIEQVNACAGGRAFEIRDGYIRRNRIF